MPRTVTQNPEKPNNDDFLSALERWEGIHKPTHVNLCYGSKNHTQANGCQPQKVFKNPNL